MGNTYHRLNPVPANNLTTRDPGPAPVMSLRAQLNSVAGVVICCPEYAHGVPGTLKNALDWRWEVASWWASRSASGTSPHAHASLVEILRTMAALVVPEANVTCPGAPQSELIECLNRALLALAGAV